MGLFNQQQWTELLNFVSGGTTQSAARPTLPAHPDNQFIQDPPASLGEWDYQDANAGERLGPKNQPLPERALEWDPYGRPYYGEGISGWWNGVVSRFTAPREDQLVSFDESQSLAADAVNKLLSGEIWKTFGVGVTALVAFAEEAEQRATNLSGAGETKPDVFSLAGAARIADEIVRTIITAADLLSKTGKRIVTTPVIVVKELAEESDLPALGTPDYVRGEGFFGNIDGFMGTVVSSAWDLVRATQAVTNKELNVMNTIEKSIQASRMGMTAIFEEQTRNEYFRRLDSGLESPILLAMELENPWLEALGEIGIDLFTQRWWSKVTKTARLRYGHKSIRASLAPDSEVVDIISNLPQNMDEITAATKVNELTEVLIRQTNDTIQGITKNADEVGLTIHTAAGKRTIMEKRVQPIIVAVVGSADNMDEALEVFSSLRHLYSGDPTRVIENLSVIKHFGGQEIFFSPAGRELGVLLNKLETEKWADNFINASTDIERLNIVTQNVGRAIDDLYPTLTQRIAKDASSVPPHLRFLDKAHTRAQKFFLPLNTGLSYVFMRMNPGFWLRNLQVDTLTIAIDEGVRAAFSTIKNAERRILANSGGVLSPGAKRLLDKTAIISEEVAEKVSKLRGPTFAKVETASATRVYASSQGRALGSYAKVMANDIEALRGVLPDSVIDVALSVNKATNGDISKIADALVDGGSYDFMRGLNWISPEDLAPIDAAFGGGMREGILDALGSVLDEGGTLDNAVEALEDIFRQSRDEWNKAQKTIVPMNPEDVRDLPGMAAISQAEEAGDMAKVSVEHAYVQTQANLYAENMARQSLQDMLDDALARGVDPQAIAGLETKYAHILTEGTSIQMAKRTQNYWDDAFDLSYPGGNRGASAGKRLAFRTKVVKEFGGVEKAWTQFGLPGDAPSGLTIRELYNTYWDQWTRPRVRDMWKANREVIAESGQSLVDEMLELGLEPQSNSWDRVTEAFDNARRYDNALPIGDGHIVEIARQETRNLLKLGMLYKLPGAKVVDGFVVPNKRLLNTLRKYGNSEWEHINDIPFDEGKEALEAYARSKNLPIVRQVFEEAVEDVGKIADEAVQELGNIVPPTLPNNGHGYTMPQMMYASKEGYERMFERLTQGLKENWGNRVALNLSSDEQKIIREFVDQAKPKMIEARAFSDAVATEAVDFAIHDYRNRRGMDLVLSYLMPWQFWHTRTYTKWITQRLVRNPGIIAAYASYRDTMEKVHADMPEWWKYQLNTDDLGITLFGDSPVFFDLERSLNPVYGLTGANFNDPGKRVNQWTAIMDDLGKFGPSIHPLWNIAIALKLMSDGEDDAAARWGGTGLFPQIRVARAIDALIGDDKLLQDPLVTLFSDGIDPYEERRMGRAAYAILQERPELAAQMFDEFQAREGELWDEALLRAANERAPANLASFFLGVGYKPRSAQDIELDRFDQARLRLFAISDNLSPDEFRVAMLDLRKAYPFGDLVILSRKGGLSRDRSFAYSVLSRMPPGTGFDSGEAAGIPGDLLSRFYEDKGDMAEWGKADHDRFMAGILDLAAVLELPDNATQVHWAEAKSRNAQMRDIVSTRFGEEIWDQVTVFYGLFDDTEAGRDKAYAYLDSNPLVEMAMDLRRSYIINDPVLAQYYGGIDVINDYYRGLMFDDIEAQLGSEVFDLWDDYWFLKNSGISTRNFWKEHPALEIYNQIKDSWEPIIAQKVLEIGGRLQPGAGIEFRDAVDLTSFQRDLMPQLEAAGLNTVIPQDIWQEAFGPAYPDIYGFAVGQVGLSAFAQSALEAVSNNVGMDPAMLMQVFKNSLASPLFED